MSMRTRRPTAVADVIELARARVATVSRPPAQTTPAEHRAAFRRWLAVRLRVPMPDATRALLSGGDGGQLRDTEPLRAVRAWLDSRSAVLVMLGRPGTGKTFAAAWAMLRAQLATYDPKLDCDRFRGVLEERAAAAANYRKVRDLARLYRAGFGDERAEYDALRAVPMLVIDELGLDRGRDVGLVRSALHDLIDERQGSGRRTILVSNLDRAELVGAEGKAGALDPRTVERLREVGVLREFGGPSMRGAR